MPGLPLDGGRVLKAIVWGATGNAHRGTIVAGWGGRVTAVAVLGWPLLQEEIFDVRATILDFALAFVIALFLWTGATSAMSSARLRRRLPELVARDLARRTLTVPDDLPLGEAVRRAQEAQAGGIVTVDQQRRPDRRGQRGRPARHARGPTPLGRGLDGGPDPRGGAPAAGRDHRRGPDPAISRAPAHEYLLVEDDGSIYGVLATADVDQAFREPRARSPRRVPH